MHSLLMASWVGDGVSVRSKAAEVGMLEKDESHKYVQAHESE